MDILLRDPPFTVMHQIVDSLMCLKLLVPGNRRLSTCHNAHAYECEKWQQNLSCIFDKVGISRKLAEFEVKRQIGV